MPSPKIRGTSKSIVSDERHRLRRCSLVPGRKAPPPQPVGEDETPRPQRHSYLRARGSSASLSSAFTTGHFICGHLYFQRPLSSFLSWTWRSGGWRRWTPARRRLELRVRTATFISLRPGPTAAGRRSCRATAPKFTATKLWLILEGLCPETSRR